MLYKVKDRYNRYIKTFSYEQHNYTVNYLDDEDYYRFSLYGAIYVCNFFNNLHTLSPLLKPLRIEIVE